jgi:hypothetical protein
MFICGLAVDRVSSFRMIAFFLAALTRSDPFASEDDPDTDIPDTEFPDLPTGEARSEKQITLIVLLSIFAFGLVFVGALCCVKRRAIGKALGPDHDHFEPFAEVRPYTMSPEFADLMAAPHLIDHPRSWYG